MGKRSRACEECHRLKIKCDVAEGTTACDRCVRNKLECTPAAPRFQRDRIQELEAEVQELRDALRGHQIGSVSSTTTPDHLPDGYPKARAHHNTVLSFLDARIPPSIQQHLLRLFAEQAGTAWPVICVTASLERMRAESPVLLLSVLVYAVLREAQGTGVVAHDELIQETTCILGEEVIGKGGRSLELVQALLITVFWYKPTRRGLQASCYQLVQLAVDMAIDLGIAGPSLQPSPPAYFCRIDDPGSIEARRTWLVCYVALSTWSMSLRRPNTVPWNAYHQECLWQLENRGAPSDLLLCQIVRVNQVIQEIAEDLRLCHLGADFMGGNDHNTHITMETLKSKVNAWAAQVPASLASSQTLKVWHHVAMIHIYEPVLHTPTNKACFAAPFIPGRIAVKDFPRPPCLSPSLCEGLEAIVRHSHAVIDTAVDMEPALILSLPPFCFAPTVLYALFVLVTTFVAATDPTNTYGQYVTRDGLNIEQYGLRLRSLTARLVSLDPTMSSFTTRFIDATSWLETWYNDYMAILRRYEDSLVGQ